MVIHCIFKLRNHLIVSNILAVFSAMNIKSSIILRKHMKSVSIIGKFMGIANKNINNAQVYEHNSLTPNGRYTAI